VFEKITDVNGYEGAPALTIMEEEEEEEEERSDGTKIGAVVEKLNC
jgi:hypothetical protein